MIDQGAVNLLGIRISAVDYACAVQRIMTAAEAEQPLGVSAMAVHGVMTGVLDPVHRHRLNSLDLLLPDGQPVRWGINSLHGLGLQERVYGPRLMLEICAEAERRQMPICLFGGTSETLASLQANLTSQFPGLVVAAAIPSQFRCLSADEKRNLIQRIRDSGAQLTFCGLGCPRQEIWAYEFKDPLSMPVVAVGAAFNFHAGTLPQAPLWMGRFGLEWLFRLLHEPRRLWQRYLLLNPYYIWLLFCQRWGLMRFDPAKCQPPTREIMYG